MTSAKCYMRVFRWLSVCDANEVLCKINEIFHLSHLWTVQSAADAIKTFYASIADSPEASLEIQI